MIRTGEFRTAALRMATITGVALLLAMPRSAAAQTAPAPQDDPLKLSVSSPTMILMQINADKTADFEATLSSIKAAWRRAPKTM